MLSLSVSRRWLLTLQNMKEVYNATFQSFPEEIRSSHNGDVLSYLNGSLDILDLGCGTGLIGSWFKDYARKLVGVDVSPTMLDMATKKGCYHELRKGVSDQPVTAVTLYMSYCITENMLVCRKRTRLNTVCWCGAGV